jgi:hypothetical protein
MLIASLSILGIFTCSRRFLRWTVESFAIATRNSSFRPSLIGNHKCHLQRSKGCNRGKWLLPNNRCTRLRMKSTALSYRWDCTWRTCYQLYCSSWEWVSLQYDEPTKISEMKYIPGFLWWSHTQWGPSSNCPRDCARKAILLKQDEFDVGPCAEIGWDRRTKRVVREVGNWKRG